MATNSLQGFSSTILGYDVADIQAELNYVNAPKAPKVNNFAAFATRFSEIPIGVGVINVPIPQYSTGSTINGNTGGLITIGPANTINAPVALSNDYYKFIAFNPTDVQAAGLTELVTNLIDTQIYGVETTLLSASFAVIQNPANFITCSVHPSGSVAAGFTVNTAIQINAALTNAGINAGERTLGLNSNYYWTGLLADLANKNNAAGAAAIQSGNPNNPLSMVVSELDPNLFPTNNNIIGFAGTRGGVIVGTAIPTVVHANGEAAVITSPRSGIPMLIEKWFNESTRQWVIGASVVGNVVPGNNVILQLTSQ